MAGCWQDDAGTDRARDRDAILYEKNPVRRVGEGRETLHRRLDLPDDHLDFDVLFELREHGGTDYLALPIAGVHAVDYMVTSVTDRPGGFAADEIDNLVALLPIGYPLGRFGPVCRIPLADVVYEDYRDL